jgi:preprotein translocase subunit SecD
MKVRVKSETLRDWRVLLLILVDLMALLAVFPRVTRSTTEFSMTELNSSEVIKSVLEANYQDVVHIYSAFDGGLWVHGYSFNLTAQKAAESLENELRSSLGSMVPRGLPPVARVNGTLAWANITTNDRDAFITLLEDRLGGKIVSAMAIGDELSMVMNRRVTRDQLLEVLGTSARITQFENPRTLKTNVKMGIDFLGGFYYNVKPVGITFNVRCSSANITPMLVGEFINTSVRVEEDGEDGILTLAITTPEFTDNGNQTPANVSEILMNAIVDEFFKTYGGFGKVSFDFDTETSELVLNATNYNALQAALNSSLSLRYDIVGGNEPAGIFEVEGTGSEATLAELRANLSRFLAITDYEAKVSPETMSDVEKMIQSRANFIGLADLRIKRAANEYILVESPERIASNSSVLQPLDFEARLWKDEDETIPVFDSEDVARVDHFLYMPESQGWAVPLTLSREAAERMRALALDYGAISEDAEVREQHKLGMFFEGIEVYNASFSEGLAEQMREEYVVSILAMTGGPRENEEARDRAEELWINLEASFPTKLQTVGEGQIPPVLGQDFSRQVAAAAAAALVGVSLVIYLRYRRPRLVLAILWVSLSEVLIILGFAVAIGWYLDLASVAGIIAVMGTGVDHQIVITDEALYQGEGRKRLVISTRISRAFFIIFTAAATTIIAMTPLAYVGLGRLRGFAIVTIVGVLSGVIISRPAYARIVRRVIGGR